MAAKYLVKLTTRNKSLLRGLPARGRDIFISTAQNVGGDLFSVKGFLTKPHIAYLRRQGVEVEVKGRAETWLRAGEEVARTYLKKGEMPDGYLSVEQIASSIARTAREYRSIARSIRLPHKTHQGRSSRALKIGRRASGKKLAILFVAGQHAREVVPPDALVYLARVVCRAYSGKTNVNLGKKTYRAAEIKEIVDKVDIYVVPLANPDGRALVLKPAKRGGDPDWRKNLNPNGGDPDKGVDVNRNYDFLWDHGIGTSSLFESDVYKGVKAGSEPETRNVLHLLDNVKQLVCSVDVHSHGALILHPWGHDESQSRFRAINFREEEFDGFRGKKDDAYKEFMPFKDQRIFSTIGKGIQAAIAAVHGHKYTLQQGIDLYATTGTLMDYPYSRHLSDRRMNKVFSFTIEVAPGLTSPDNYGFQPPFKKAKDIIQEVVAGLLECCLTVIKLRGAHKL